MRFNLYATRDEILEEDVVFHKVGSDAKNTFSKSTLSKGQTVIAVYEGVINISTLRTLGYMQDEVGQIKNAITALYAIHGDKCLKSKFLTKELAKMLPHMLIETVMTENATKYYTYSNGIKEYVSHKQDLYKQENLISL